MTIRIPRYLAPFHPKSSPHYFTDVLIIGGGLAGLRAANAVDPSLSVMVVTKDKLKQSNSNYAQGGIAGVLAPEDNFENHIADTLTAGGELCNKAIVDLVIREAPSRIDELIRWGTNFDKDDGKLVLAREGGHSHHRVVHALGDATGKEVMRAVIDWTREQPQVQIWEDSFTLDLLTDRGICRGAVIHNSQGHRSLVWAKQTILCTGGAGQLYRETTNPGVATADGHAVAYRAGAELRDMEFMQFHPTVLYIAGSSRSLITEAMRGEGSHLVDRNGERFMLRYDERGELAPRDVVSQAIVNQMEETRHPCVYLDQSHLDADYIRKRFPGIAESCLKFGIDIATDRIPVRPGAHYMIGGITVDDRGQTSLPGLWAAGEVTSTGLHGANRLASNSLLEGLVYGARAGEAASAAALGQEDDFHALCTFNEFEEGPDEPLDIVDISNSLKSLMWHAAGVRRERSHLIDALETVETWCKYVLVRQFLGQEGWELQNMLTVSLLTLRSALEREESRGVHLRTDFPEKDESWERHLTFQIDGGQNSTKLSD
ncbi:MAG: L-aspartate oxidase [Pirellulaceae bacterium]|jgi:L-aspartate oxidase